MKIIHTADWHLCDQLGRLNRSDDLKQRVERVAAYCHEHAVDLLLIAGDLFYERAGLDQLSDALGHIRRTFRDFFQRGGTIVAITGNHDEDAKIDLIRSGLFLAAPFPSGETLARGRMYLQNGLSYARFESTSGERIQLVMVPYPRAARFGLDEAYRTREEEHRLLQEQLTRWMADVFHRPNFNSHLPTILMAHLHIRGANLGQSLFRISDADDILIDPGFLKSGWTYVALGHIHLPQAVGGVPTIRYSGPLDRLDFGERNDERGVILIDVGSSGLKGEPMWLPLPPTPMHDITLNDPDRELGTLNQRYPDYNLAIVRVSVHADSGKLSRDQIVQQLKRTFPRLHQIIWAAESERAASNQIAAATIARVSFKETVRDYLRKQFANDPDQTAILDLADCYLAKLESHQ